MTLVPDPESRDMNMWTLRLISDVKIKRYDEKDYIGLTRRDYALQIDEDIIFVDDDGTIKRVDIEDATFHIECRGSTTTTPKRACAWIQSKLRFDLEWPDLFRIFNVEI